MMIDIPKKMSNEESKLYAAIAVADRQIQVSAGQMIAAMNRLDRIHNG